MKRRVLIGILVVIVLLGAALHYTDFLRWQMIRGLFWRPGEIDPHKETIVIIDPMYSPPTDNWIINPAYCLADYIQRIADVNIDIIHYPEANTARVMKNEPVCVLISGQTAPWTDYDPQKLDAVFIFLEETPLPVLGICGGHQVIAMAFGTPVAPMGYQELGYIQVELIEDDPVLAGLESPITVFSWHGEEAKRMPEEFILLGSSLLCAIQIFSHSERDLYGVQFHPELSGRRPDGHMVIRNFLQSAGINLIE